jgi:hypothetical protein
MNQPAKIFLSQLPSGGLAVFSGSIFGGDRKQASDPRHNLRERLAKMMPGDRAKMMSLVRKIGAAELQGGLESLHRKHLQ